MSARVDALTGRVDTLNTRVEKVEGRLEQLSVRVDTFTDDVRQRFRTVNERLGGFGA